MWTATFNPKGGELWAKTLVRGPRAEGVLSFLIDTGTRHTILDTAAAEDLGFDATQATRRSRLWGIGGPQDGYCVLLPSLEVMGLILPAFEIACHDLAPELGVEGLIGMDLLRGRVLNIDGVRGTVTLGS